jgi:hypothetical protein
MNPIVAVAQEFFRFLLAAPFVKFLTFLLFLLALVWIYRFLGG